MKINGNDGFTKAFREADTNNDGKLSKQEAEEANKKWRGLFEFKEGHTEKTFLEDLNNKYKEEFKKNLENPKSKEKTYLVPHLEINENVNPSDETNSLDYAKRLLQERSEKLKEYKNSVINKEPNSNMGL